MSSQYTTSTVSLNATNIVSDSILDSSGSPYLTKDVADELYNNGASAELDPSIVVVSDSSGALTSSTISATELGYLDGVTSNVQTLLDTKLSYTYWKSGDNWYRKYSDGWIEQGGYHYINAAKQTPTISLNTAFSNTNYYLNFKQITTNSSSLGNDTVTGIEIHAWAVTKTSFKCYLEYTGGCRWYACGY